MGLGPVQRTNRQSKGADRPQTTPIYLELGWGRNHQQLLQITPTIICTKIAFDNTTLSPLKNIVRGGEGGG